MTVKLGAYSYATIDNAGLHTTQFAMPCIVSWHVPALVATRLKWLRNRVAALQLQQWPATIPRPLLAMLFRGRSRHQQHLYAWQTVVMRARCSFASLAIYIMLFPRDIRRLNIGIQCGV